MDPLTDFTAATRAWFEASFPAPTAAQAEGWPAIASGENTLIHAPTGSGKTLAAFLWTLDRLLAEPLPAKADRTRVLYVSPLKALAHDVDRNLRAPLAGIRHASERLGGSRLPELTTFLRTGDTSQEERRRMERSPSDILITTPESLYLMLTSAVRSTLAAVRWVIVDEVHAVAGTKRGAHLALSLERLEELTTVPPQRIGLSATQRPLDTIAEFLGGGTIDEGTWSPRPVRIIDVPASRELDLELTVPVEDMTAPAAHDPLDPDRVPQRSIWPAVYPALLEQIEQHRSTIVFANSRRLAERVCAEINRLADAEIARAHHGSVAREQRLEIEEALKRGELRAVVATSSLELGIDMGAVDLVLQIESPGSVASGLQRVGRSRHQVGEVSKARIYPKYRGDLLVATVVASEMLQGNVEPTRVPENPLDVLCQQMVAHVVPAETTVDDLYDLVRRATPFKSLPRSLFDETLDMLAGRYPSDLFSELRPRVNWDRVAGTVSARPGARQLAVTNAGTIPDRGLFRVSLPDGSRVGELDEEMVYESREGDTFLLGSSAWRITEIDHDRVVVIPAGAEGSHKMPFWHGDQPGRPIETGRAVGQFVREVGAMDGERALALLERQYHLDRLAASNLVSYLHEELEATGGHLPTDRQIVVERFQDEIGDWRMVVLSPFGARVHAPWAMALRHRLRETYGADVDMIWSDDGIAIRFPDTAEIPEPEDILLDPDEVESILIAHLGDTALFAARFREAAGRSLLLPRKRPGERTPLWLQRRKAADLLGVAHQFGSFPIVLETYREVLRDDFDLPALQGLLGEIRSRKVRLVGVDLPAPSPFATSLLFSFVAAYLYEADAPLAERRAAALTLDRDLLQELLGDGELRELIDPEVVAAVELELQYLTARRTPRHPDALHDMLRDLGPLSMQDIMVRSSDAAPDHLDQLLTAGRVAPVTIAGEARFAVIEDMARLRDGLGVQPPEGVPLVYLEPVPDPVGDVVGRYARTHAPFAVADAARSLGLPIAVVAGVLASLESEGRVTRGAFLRGGKGQEWVDTGVLRRLKRKSLAILRQEIEPVVQERLAHFVIEWQGITSEPPRGANAAADAITRLQGAAIPATVIERDVLVDRARDAEAHIDRMLTAGDLVWVGRGALGSRDGKVALFHRDSLASLWHGPDDDFEPEGKAVAILAHLTARGASFFRDIYDGIGGGDIDEAAAALWDLVWAGLVTNDSFEPVRRFVARRGGSGRRRQVARFPTHTSGRWSLVEDIIRERPSPTERQAAWAHVMLDRYGVVARATVLAEAHPGGFAGIYPVYARLEETGRLRRGYFVEGLGGSQFALPGAVDRLRSEGVDEVFALAATDPANLYGAALPWPDHETRLARDAGAYVFLREGRLVAYLDKGRRNVTLFPGSEDVHAEIGREIAAVAARHRRTVLVSIDDESASVSAMAPTLREWGFAPDPKGLAYRR